MILLVMTLLLERDYSIDDPRGEMALFALYWSFPYY